MRCYLFTTSCALTVLFVFFSHGAFVVGDELPKSLLNVGLYYESLCPDSIRWIKHELLPSYDEVKDYIKLTFVPYGKASHKLDAETGQWHFSCQHGPDECQGNIAQACGINAIESNEPTGTVQQLSVSLVGCVMTSRNPATSVPQCAQSVGLSEMTRTSIDHCINGQLGKDLFVANGEKTAALNPHLSFVPTITIDGVISQETQSKALNNFLKLICEKLPKENSPSKCSSV